MKEIILIVSTVNDRIAVFISQFTAQRAKFQLGFKD